MAKGTKIAKRRPISSFGGGGGPKLSRHEADAGRDKPEP
jgi:hypothetical protein